MDSHFAENDSQFAEMRIVNSQECEPKPLRGFRRSAGDGTDKNTVFVKNI